MKSKIIAAGMAGICLINLIGCVQPQKTNIETFSDTKIIEPLNDIIMPAPKKVEHTEEMEALLDKAESITSQPIETTKETQSNLIDTPQIEESNNEYIIEESEQVPEFENEELFIEEEPIQEVIEEVVEEKEEEEEDYNTDGLTSYSGVNNYNDRTETYYSSDVLYHQDTDDWTLDEEGFYRTDEGYYVVAASDMPQGTTFEGSKGTCIVLDDGCEEGTTDYYTN